MKLLLLLNIFCLVLLANCEQLSTVFVLETSDSTNSGISTTNTNNGDISTTSGGNQSTNNNRESKVLEEPSTRIITDNSDSTATNQQHHQHLATNHQQPTTQHHNSNHNNHHQAAQQHHHNNDHNDHQQANQHNNNNNKHNEQYQANPQHHDNNHNEHQQHPKPITRSAQTSQQVKPKASSTTTTSTTTESSYQTRDKSYNNNNNNAHSGTPPNTEERLLISITSDDDDTYSNSKPPKKVHLGSGSISSNYDDSLSSSSSSQPSSSLSVGQPPKRKPSITISIQDANLKQDGTSGSSGSPAVILRPIENGQSIVISTVGVSSNSNQSPMKHVNKPSISILNPNNEGPLEIPVQHVHHTSTTYRPSVNHNTNHISSSNSNNDYLPSANRPLTSTLVDPPIRPSSISEERPQRPSSNDGGYDREPSRPITQRPSVQRPPLDNSYGSNNNNDLDISNSNAGLTNPTPNSVNEPKYPLNEKNCGLLHETRIVGGEEANPDDYLWMAAIIKSKPGVDGESRPFCGGSLITRRHILTAAHCLENLAPRDVLVRLGSYDFDDATASSLSADYAIDQFRVPAQYSKKTHSADIAIMRLKTPLSLNDNYKTVCMPQARRSYVGALGTVTGYGSQSQTFRRAAPKLRQVTVPIWENRKCSVVYKKNLTESYLCAGYEEGGKDACQGDSGGPLMTEGPNDKMMVVGVVSHGIGCGSPGYPGVYTRTTTFIDWIEKNTRE